MHMKHRIPFLILSLLILITLSAVLLLSPGKGRKKEDYSYLKLSGAKTVSAVSEAECSEEATVSVLGEREELAKSSNSRRKKAVLLASVAKRNVNVMITDEDGDVISGEEFHVYFLSADNKRREYADYDKDGVIHALDLPSGKYSVNFVATDDYRAESSVEVKVREEVEYASVARVIQLIKNEKDVDTEKEDTANMREEDDGSLLESGGIDLEGGSVGIDVSRYNKDIDWETVKESGVEFAIIRLGYRGSASGVLVEDSFFTKNYEEAKAAGLKIGVYFVTQAVTEEEAEEEAEMVAALTNVSDLSTPVFLDVESSGGRGDHIDKDTRTVNINAFCRKIEEFGYKAGVYANKKWFNKKSKRIKNY